MTDPEIKLREKYMLGILLVPLLYGILGWLFSGCATVETRSDRPGSFDTRPVKNVRAK